MANGRMTIVRLHWEGPFIYTLFTFRFWPARWALRVSTLAASGVLFASCGGGGGGGGGGGRGGGGMRFFSA